MDLQFDHRLRPPSTLVCTCRWQGDGKAERLRLTLVGPKGEETLSLFPSSRSPVTRELSLAGIAPGRYQLILTAEGSGSPAAVYAAPLNLAAPAAVSWRCRPYRGWFHTVLVSTGPVRHDQITVMGAPLPFDLAAGIPAGLLTRSRVTPLVLRAAGDVRLQQE